MTLCSVVGVARGWVGVAVDAGCYVAVVDVSIEQQPPSRQRELTHWTRVRVDSESVELAIRT